MDTYRQYIIPNTFHKNSTWTCKGHKYYNKT